MALAIIHRTAVVSKTLYRARSRSSNHPCLDSFPSLDSRAPSWSWVCCNGVVEHRSFDGSDGTEEVIRLLEMNMELASTKPFGQVAGGSLTVLCHLVPALAVHNQNNRYVYQLGLSEDMDLNDPRKDMDECFVGFVLTRAYGNMRPIYCLPLRKESRQRSYQPFLAELVRYTIGGLLLLPVGSTRTSYRRVEMFQTYESLDIRWLVSKKEVIKYNLGT